MLGWACPGLLHRQKGSQPSAHPAECPLIEESNPEERNAANNEDTAPAFPSPQQSISQTVKSMAADALHKFCGASMGDRVLKSVRNGAIVGLIRGAAVGFVGSEATLGEFTFGVVRARRSCFRGNSRKHRRCGLRGV